MEMSNQVNSAVGDIEMLTYVQLAVHEELDGALDRLLGWVAS